MPGDVLSGPLGPLTAPLQPVKLLALIDKLGMETFQPDYLRNVQGGCRKGCWHDEASIELDDENHDDRVQALFFASFFQGDSYWSNLSIRTITRLKISCDFTLLIFSQCHFDTVTMRKILDTETRIEELKSGSIDNNVLSSFYIL